MLEERDEVIDVHFFINFFDDLFHFHEALVLFTDDDVGLLIL